MVVMQLFKDKHYYYRIPSLIKCKEVLIACVDKRYFSQADNPNKITKVIKRSFDNGKTWSDEIEIISMPGDSINNAAAAVDPQLLYNEASNTLFLLYCMTPAGIGFFNSKVGTGYLKDKLLLYKNNTPYKVVNSEIINLKTKEKLKEEFQDFSINNQSVLLNSEYKIYETSYLMLAKSTDLGLTWSKPVCLNPMVKTKQMAFIGAAPGVGNIISYKGKNRLLFPIYYTIKHNDEIIAKSAIMYSDDNGESFKLSKSPNLLADNIKEGSYKFLTESQILVNKNIIYLIQRNHHSKRKVLIYLSTNFGKSFNKGFFINIKQPISMISAIKYYDKFLIANPMDSKDRLNGTLSVLDFNFNIIKQIPLTKDHKDYFGYVSITDLGNNQLGILYENTDQFRSMEFITLDLSNI